MTSAVDSLSISQMKNDGFNDIAVAVFASVHQHVVVRHVKYVFFIFRSFFLENRIFIKKENISDRAACQQRPMLMEPF
jgi:hypothetical protein